VEHGEIWGDLWWGDMLENKSGNISETRKDSGGSRKKYLGGLAPHHLGGNHG